MLKRKPTRPGEILLEEFMKPLNLTQKVLAQHINVDVKTINRLINGKTHLTATMALKLAHTFKTSPEFWLNAQNAVDLHEAIQELSVLPEVICEMQVA
jgi:addiction module HigA family antidote